MRGRPEEMSLADAVAQYRAIMPGASAYETYRSHASRSGSVYLGAWVPTRKDGRGRWVVSVLDLDRGLAAEREYLAQKARNTSDYENHVLHGEDEEPMETDWGHYFHRGPFHFVFDRYQACSRVSDGWWVCSNCWTPTTNEHNHEQCHTCSDWGDCRRDCTLSAVRCDKCGTRLGIGAVRTR
jgi:hypothetical protein